MLTALLVASLSVHGTVFDDRNANGRRDAGEAGIPGVVVSNQRDVVRTDAKGDYFMNESGTGVTFVSVADGWKSVGPFWRRTSGGTDAVDFALVRSPLARDFTFIHASDTHIAPASVARTERLRAIVDSVKPAFVIITGDLVRDALRVGEAEATGYYELFNAQAAKFTVPLWTVPGNHENFGIERDKSGVAATHPLYGRVMYHQYRGPDYYSFNAGGIHFVGVNSVDIDDTRYYGHVDADQLAWLARDLAEVPPNVPIVTFQHIPFVTAVDAQNGYNDAPPAPSLITVNGKTNYRHVVSNTNEFLAAVGKRPYPVALQGHMHVRESISYDGVPTRFFTAAGVISDSPGKSFTFPSGATVFRVRNGVIDNGTFVKLGATK